MLFQSCRQENLYADNEDNSLKAKPVISVLNYEDIENTDKALFKEIKNLKNKFSLDRGFSGRTVQDSLLDGAVIETNKILLIEDGDKKTYTIPVSRTFPNNKIENLILKKNFDNSFSGLLAQYTVTEQQRQHFLNGNPINLDSNAKFYKIDNINIGARVQTDVVGCYEITWETGYCSSGQHSSGHDSGCTVGGTPQPAIISVVDTCDPGSSGGSSDGGGASSGGGFIGPISGGGGGVSTQPTSPYNTFMFMSFDDMYLLCSEGDTQCAVNWANMSATVNVFTALGRNGLMLPSYTQTFTLVKDYLVANSFSSDAQAYISERLNIVGNWMKLQDNSTDEKLLKNHQFAYWTLNYLAFENPDVSNHFMLHPEDVKKIKFKNLDYSNYYDVTFASKYASAFTEILIAEKSNTVSQINIQDITWKAAKEYMIYLIKQNAASTVKYGRVIYEHSSEYFSQHPNSLAKVNEFLEYLKAGVESEAQVIYDPKYMKWTDILLCWLFELGDFPVNDSAGYGNIPTIGFSGSDYTISGIPSPNIIPMRYLSAHKMKNGIPDANSVLDLKGKAIDNIKIGVLTPIHGDWVFGSDATVETITKLDGMQFCLGSYSTDVFINALGNNQYKLTFIIKNKTGWQSGTRGLNDYNGNPLDDSIIPDKPRGTGVLLGGTIGETFGWQEIINVP